MKIYLDNCCYNRLFDKQNQLVIEIEAKAIAYILQRVATGDYSLTWSFILEYENDENPYVDRRQFVEFWQGRASDYVEFAPDVERTAAMIMTGGIKMKDAYHIACAVAAGCDYFITTDKRLYASPPPCMTIINPFMFLVEVGGRK